MAGEVKLPGIGPVDQRWVWAGGAAVVGIVGWAYLHRPTTATADPTDSAGAWSGEGIDDGGVWPWRPGGETVNTDPIDPDKLPPANNAEWTRRVVDYLAGSLGYDAALVATVLGKYLARKPIAPGQESDVLTAALAAWGNPPQGEYSVILQPPGTVPPPAAKTIHRMQWVQVKTGLPGTISQKQRAAAVEAAALGAWRPSGASLNAIILEAARKNRVGVNTSIRVGTTIWIYKAVKQG